MLEPMIKEEGKMEKGLTGNKLKLIAILSMTLDHVISVLYPNYPTHWRDKKCSLECRL